MAQALYRKWRSQTFDEVVGQEHVTRTLRNALREGRIAHAYLFSGPRGTGKTSTARLLAKAVNCLHEDAKARPDNRCEVCQAINAGAFLDLIEIDAASNRGIDEIRDLRDKVHFAPSRGRYKVYVVDEVHMLTTEAFNALLKTLEEPPPHVIFVLATTEPHRIPETVLSRCQRFDFRRIPTPEIVRHLERILEGEGRAAEPAALEMIARSAEGCMRDAISLLDQLLSYGSEVVTAAQVQAVRGTIAATAISGFVDALAGGDAAQGLRLISQLADEGVDLRQLALQLVEHLRSVLVVCVGKAQASHILSDLSPEQFQVVQAQAERFEAGNLTRAVRVLNQAAVDMRDAAQPQLTLELAWLEAVQAAAQGQPAALREAAPTATAPPSWPQPVAAAPAAPTSPSRKAPAPERPALPRPAAPVPEDQVVSVLRAHWTALLQAVEQVSGGSVRGALRSVRSVVAHGDDLYFSFENEFSRALVDRPANRLALQELVAELLARPVRLHCQVGSASEVVGSSRPSAPGVASASRKESDPPVVHPADDPVVEHAVQKLGAVKRILSDDPS
ncbi:MAG: DNA polymerase III subunit gamma/tau [Caldilineales bacterium]|nr:DNA polymerase III subunit gamma/tau [Caldilineales bacterium]MDW8318332.1 DNA polymerase III subunit gamma/tau [Anaerolineae bacterium]